MNNINGFSYVWREFIRRLKAPVGNLTFWVQFVFGILGASAFGVWYELLPVIAGRAEWSPQNLYVAVVTFFPALALPSALQLFFEDDSAKPFKAAIIAVGAFVLFFALLLALNPPNFTGWRVALLCFGVAAASLMWWISSGQDPAFKDNIEAPLGGPTDQVNKGDTEGFQV